MRLQLKNFRCYEEKEFDFGDNGLLLLSGPSGLGKSSVMLAINFALYGKGTKLVTYGKTSCRVELDFQDFNIVRTKRPNRLVVNHVHEDESGQAMIDKKFGKTFDVTGYIAQNALNSFVLMGPMEKLGFLERFAFADIDLSQLKHKCRELMKKRNEQLIATTSQLEMATHVLSEMEEPEEVPYPLKSTKNKEKAIKNETVRLKNSETLIRKTQRSLTKWRAELASLNVLDAKTRTKNSALAKVVEKLDDLLFEQQTTEYEGDELLQKYEDQLLTLVSQRELQLLEQRYEDDEKRLEEMIETERHEAEDKIEKITKGLWEEYSEEDIKTTVEEFKKLLKDVKALESLRESLANYEIDTEKLENYKKELKSGKELLDTNKEFLAKLKLQKEMYTCPSCEQTLRFQDDELCVADEVDVEEVDIKSLEKDISVLDKRISRLEYVIPQEQNRVDRHNEITLKIQGIRDQYDEDDLPPISDVESDLDYIKDYKKAQTELEKQKKELEKTLKEEKYSTIITTFKDGLKKQKKKIRQLRKKTIVSEEEEEDIDEQELRIKIQLQKRNKEKLTDIEKRVKILTQEKSTYQSEIIHDKEEHIELYKKIRDVDDVQKSITKRQEELVALENKRDRHAENVKKIEEYNKYLYELDRYQEWIDKVKDMKEKEEVDRRKYAAATLLKEKILEAESIAMINIINSINSHVQVYLDLFFTVHPMCARLLPYKESKKSKKPQINIQIEYKGMEADLGMLSGGELSRVVLAFALGLGEIFNTPIMLLDECTASLDQDLTSLVIDGIREHYGDKLVIIIAHQSINGTYDRVIELGNE